MTRDIDPLCRYPRVLTEVLVDRTYDMCLFSPGHRSGFSRRKDHDEGLHI